MVSGFAVEGPLNEIAFSMRAALHRQYIATPFEEY
jgi:hypothetical protein